MGENVRILRFLLFGDVFWGLGRVFVRFLNAFGRVWALFAHLDALIELWGLRRGTLSGSWGGF